MLYHWKVLTIGHLSRNRYWGESEEESYRAPLATCTLLQSEDGTRNILIDPSLPGQAMREALFQNSGLHPEQITHIFSTHWHGDHCDSPDAFPDACWYMSAVDRRTLLATASAEPNHPLIRAGGDTLKACIPLKPGEWLPGVEAIPLPGHTGGTCGLLFSAPEGRVLAAGDAVMTGEFFAEGRPYFFCDDQRQSQDSIRKAASLADIILPGHGPAFLANVYLPSNRA